MLPTTIIEEMLSSAQVSAIVAKAGSTFTVPKDFGTDISVHRIHTDTDGSRIDMGSAFDMQLKASIHWSYSGTDVKFKIKAKAYNKLVKRREGSFIPCILVVCLLPKDESKWLDVCESNLTLSHCCYYYFVSGGLISNSSSITLSIPRAQILTPAAVQHLVEQARIGAI